MPPLDLGVGGSRIGVVQGRSAAVPGSFGRLEVHLGDIAGGQVEVALRRRDGTDVHSPTPAREGESIDFVYEGEGYRFRVLRLENRHLGEDSAELEFSPSDPPAEDPRALIERLIAEVREADVVFIRNGVEHPPGSAAGHLARKWRGAADLVRTPEDFIRVCGSRSSRSGEPYRVRFADGTLLTSQEWLSSLLAKLRTGGG
jgi:hypothetical protein